jgi:rubredoxin
MATKDPEFTIAKGQKAVKVYLCQPCAAVLRGKAAAAGGVLEYVDLSWLCPDCREKSVKGPPS